jgi:hypothetical protein
VSPASPPSYCKETLYLAERINRRQAMTVQIKNQRVSVPSMKAYKARILEAIAGLGVFFAAGSVTARIN